LPIKVTLMINERIKGKKKASTTPFFSYLLE
jgi:hypothetical protein